MSDQADRTEILFEEDYALALSSNHPLAHRQTLEPDEVADAVMIVRRNCEALPDISRFFTQRGVRPFFAARTTNDDRAIAYVRAGLGITVMPRCFAQPGIAMPALSGFEQRRKIGVLHANSSGARAHDSQSLHKFAETLKHASANHSG